MFNTSNALITVNGVVGNPTVQSNGTDYADAFGFDAIAGKTYVFGVQVLGEGMNCLEESGVIFDTNNNSVGSIALDFNGGVGEFTAQADGRFYLVVGEAGAYLSQFTISMTVAESISELIDATLNTLKAYVDSKDALDKTYIETKIAELMNTTDLTAKLDLLNQINAILDGDSATAGFQAWEHSLQRLNSIEIDISATQQQLSLVSTQHYQAIQDVKRDLTNTTNSLNSSIYNVGTRLTTEAKRIDDGVTANFVAMKSKAAVIFAV